MNFDNLIWGILVHFWKAFSNFSSCSVHFCAYARKSSILNWRFWTEEVGTEPPVMGDLAHFTEAIFASAVGLTIHLCYEIHKNLQIPECSSLPCHDAKGFSWLSRAHFFLNFSLVALKWACAIWVEIYPVTLWKLWKKPLLLQ